MTTTSKRTSEHQEWKEGQQIKHEDWDRGEKVDYHHYHLNAPPRGYEWRMIDGHYIARQHGQLPDPHRHRRSTKASI